MQMSSFINKGDVWEINRVGSSFAVIRAQKGLYVRMFDENGRVTLDSELSQGVNLRKAHYVRIVLFAEQSMSVEVWVGNQEYDFTPQVSRAAKIKSYTMSTKAGVNKLLSYDPPRLRALIKSPIDIWLGGEEMESQFGVVKNGRKFVAGEEIEIQNFGDIYYFITDENRRVFVGERVQLPHVNTEPSTSGYKVRTRSELESNGVPYFDVFVPAELHNLPIIFEIKDREIRLYDESESNVMYKPTLAITVGDVKTESLKIYNYDRRSGTSFGAPTTDTGSVSGGTISVSMSSGFHRVFLFQGYPISQSASQNGQVEYSMSSLYIDEVSTLNNALVTFGDVQVMEERT